MDGHGYKAYWDIPGLACPLKDWAKRDKAPKVLGGEDREFAGLAALMGGRRVR